MGEYVSRNSSCSMLICLYSSNAITLSPLLLHEGNCISTLLYKEVPYASQAATERGRGNWKLAVPLWSAFRGYCCICFRTTIPPCIIAQAFRRSATYYAAHNIYASRCHTFFVEYFG